MPTKKYLHNIDLVQNELIAAVLEKRSTAPLTAVDGQMYYNTTDKKIYYYNGAQSAWTQVGSSIATWGNITGTLSTQTDLQNALNAKQDGLSGTGIVKSTAGVITYLTDNSANWDNAYSNRIASLTTAGSSGQATLSNNVLNIPQYQAQGNYITSLTGEVTASGPGAAAATLLTSAVTGKLLTGINIAGGSLSASDSILTAFGKLQNQINALIGGVVYQGTWNASTNTPALASSTGTKGYYYVVSTPGTTNLNGITDWSLGDWVIFNGSTWEKVDNTDAVISVNGLTGAVTLSTSQINEGSNLYYTNTRSRQAFSLTTTGSSGAATYDNTTGVFNIPQYTLTGLGGVSTSRTITIDGTTFDLSANRTWTIANKTITLSGDVSGSGTTAITATISSNVVTNSKLAQVSTATFKGRTTAGTGDVEDLTQAQATALLNQFTSTLKGVVPASGGGTTNFLRADGTWATPAGGGGSGSVTTVSIVNANGFSGTVANATTTPAITLTTTITGLLKGNGTAISAAVAGTDFQNPISLTTTGSSGAATFVSNTLNVPNYTLSGLGGVPTSRTLTINGTSFDLSADRSWTISAINSLNGLTSATQTFANDTNVTISSATSTHTIGWSGQLSIARGGTGQSTATAAFDGLNPMTTLGDMIYEGTGPTAVRLAGNTTTTKQFLTQTGTGTVSAAPAWGTILGADVPNFTSTLSGTVPASGGGTTNFLRADGTWAAPSGGGGGITSLNGLTAGTQTFATGTSGTDVNWSSATSTHTLNIPDASLTARGLVTTGAQSFNGDKIIQGSGATNATLALIVRNSSSANILQARNDGVVFLQSMQAASGTLTITGNGVTTAMVLARSGTMGSSQNHINITVGHNLGFESSFSNVMTFSGSVNANNSSGTTIIRQINIANTFTSLGQNFEYRGIDITLPASPTGGGSANFIVLRDATRIIFSVSSGGTITLGDAVNFAFNTTTGTRFGTATNQRIGFYNASPVVQPTTATAAGAFVANTGTAVNDASTFSGWTIGSLVSALRNLGLIA